MKVKEKEKGLNTFLLIKQGKLNILKDHPPTVTMCPTVLMFICFK